MSDNFIYTIKVLRVVDGDTLIASVDLGFRISQEIPLRIWGVNTPERGQKGYKEATHYLEYVLQLDKSAPIIATTVKPREKYGRWLAKIQLPDGSFLHERIIEEGFGIPYTE